MGDITSRPYRPSGDWCCEACVFGRGEHAEWCGVLKSISGGTVGEHWRVRLAKARPGEIIPISNEECEELERTPRLWCSRRRVQKFIEDQLETGVCAFANEVFRRQRLELETHSALRETFGVSSS
jgi:hypothetical protein